MRGTHVRDSKNPRVRQRTNEANLLSIVAHIRRLVARIVSVSLTSSSRRCSDRLCSGHFVVASVLGSFLYRSLRRRMRPFRC